MSARAQVVWMVALASLLGCASTQSDSDRNTPAPYASVISREELREAGVRNVYEAVQRLRPRWLVARGGMRSFSIEAEVVAFEGTLLLGTADALRRIGTDGVYQVRYIDGPTAQATLPGIKDRHVAAAIVVDMSPPEE